MVFTRTRRLAIICEGLYILCNASSLHKLVFRTRLLVLQTEEVTDRVAWVVGLENMSIWNFPVSSESRKSYRNVSFALVNGFILRTALSEGPLAPAATIVGRSGYSARAARDGGRLLVLSW